jgi:uncharacterized integral membrane protein
MLWTVVAILIVLWLLGWGFHVAGGLIHLLLVIAGIVVVMNLWNGRKTALTRENRATEEKQRRR